MKSHHQHFKDTDELSEEKLEHLDLDSPSTEETKSAALVELKDNINNLNLNVDEIKNVSAGHDTLSAFSSQSWPCEEQLKIFQNVYVRIPMWQPYMKNPENIKFTRLKGNSNACFKIELKTETELEGSVPKMLLYRRYEQKVVDKRVEQAIFKAKSEDKSGPHLYFQNNEYRIEEFFVGRPISLWEMRNPSIRDNYAIQICKFNFHKLSNIYMNQVMPCNPKQLFIHQIIDK